MGNNFEKITERDATVVNYSHPLPDQEMEDQAVALAQRFKAFRGLSAESPGLDFDLRRWTKSFRIMLHRDQRSFEDVCRVIDHLQPLQEYIDISRYTNAFDLRKDLDFLLGWVRDLKNLEANESPAERVEEDLSAYPVWQGSEIPTRQPQDDPIPEEIRQSYPVWPGVMPANSQSVYPIPIKDDAVGRNVCLHFPHEANRIGASE